MSNLISAAKQALELLKKLDRDLIIETWELAKTMGDLEQAIATEESSATQEPVAIVDSTLSDHIDWLCVVFPEQGTKLYTHPQPKAEQEPKREPLTDEQIDLMTDHIYHRGKPVDRDYRIGIFRQAEAAHGIKGEA